MPYIKQELRIKLGGPIDSMVAELQSVSDIEKDGAVSFAIVLLTEAVLYDSSALRPDQWAAHKKVSDVFEIVEKMSDKEKNGCLNYIICRVLASLYHDNKCRYVSLERMIGVLENAKSGAVNEAVGLIECAKLELYRRLVAPYEDEAIMRNGDVF